MATTGTRLSAKTYKNTSQKKQSCCDWHRRPMGCRFNGYDKFSKYNRGYNFILVAIDIFSKYVWLRPLKDKRCESVMKTLKNISAEGRSPCRIRTDKGQEFRSRLVVSLEAEMDRTCVCTEYRN